VTLDADDLGEIRDAAAKITVQGARYPEGILQLSGRWTAIMQEQWNL